MQATGLRSSDSQCCGHRGEPQPPKKECATLVDGRSMGQWFNASLLRSRSDCSVGVWSRCQQGWVQNPREHKTIELGNWNSWWAKVCGISNNSGFGSSQGRWCFGLWGFGPSPLPVPYTGRQGGRFTACCSETLQPPALPSACPRPQKVSEPKRNSCSFCTPEKWVRKISEFILIPYLDYRKTFCNFLMRKCRCCSTEWSSAMLKSVHLETVNCLGCSHQRHVLTCIFLSWLPNSLVVRPSHLEISAQIFIPTQSKVSGPIPMWTP